MTTLRSSQLTTIAVVANPLPSAQFLEVSQLITIAVIANGQHFLPMGPVIGLGCWTPCGSLAFNGE